MKTPYRPDIDCLRFFAVTLVILFHCNFQWISGGFIGVDIFFVISGFVMFKSIETIKELNPLEFYQFYKKRLYRIYPALLFALSLSTIAALALLGTTDLDFFGKQLFFSALSLSNILFSQGTNYFSTDIPTLLHTWSLAVEMQFYLIFPFYIVLYRYISRHSKILGKLFILSTLIAGLIYAQIHSDQNGAFYLIQNRAFEFIIGMYIASLNIPSTQRKAPQIALILIIASLIATAYYFKAEPNHPGVQTLIPTLLTAAYIMLFSRFAQTSNTPISAMAYIGKISYGIYLFHFPVTFFAHSIYNFDTWELLLINLFVTIPISILSYEYVETPIRRMGYKKLIPFISASAIVILTCGLSVFGFWTAKNAGWPQRLEHLNPFAYEVAQIHRQDKTTFTRGYDIQEEPAKILFIGDSLVQNYIDPITKAWNLKKEDIDAVTRGGCLLLKNVNFQDTIADISCDRLREKLYSSTKHYDIIIFSQAWKSYKQNLLNATHVENPNNFGYLEPFISQTIQDLKKRSDRIIMLGIHPIVHSSNFISATPQLKKKQYEDFKNNLIIKNTDNAKNRELLTSIAREHNIEIIHPIDLFCQEETCQITNNDWSYFYDKEHLTTIGQEYATKEFKKSLFLYEKPTEHHQYSSHPHNATQGQIE